MTRCNQPATRYATSNGYRVCESCYRGEPDRAVFLEYQELGRCDRPVLEAEDEIEQERRTR